MAASAPLFMARRAPPPGGSARFVPNVVQTRTFVGKLLAVVVCVVVSTASLAVMNGATTKKIPKVVKHYSVWVAAPPHSSALAMHRRAVDESAKKLGTPSFAPHVTLFALVQGLEADVLGAAQRVARRTKPFEVRFNEVSRGEQYFQCVYLLAEKTPELMDAHANMKAEMAKVGKVELPNADGYMPHLSLVYGHLSERDRESARSAIASSYPGLIGPEGGFVAAGVTVHETDPLDTSMRSWRTLAELPFEG